MCPFGYGNINVGLCIGCFILFGLVGCVVMGMIADKTKKLEELTKILYSSGVISLMCIGLVSEKQILMRQMTVSFSIRSSSSMKYDLIGFT